MTQSVSGFTESYFHEIARRARELAAFLDNDPQPGLATWCLVAGKKIEEFHTYATRVP